MDDRVPPAGPLRPSVKVETPAAWLAVVVVRGEHDLASKSEVREALARACQHTHVLVDLTECSFIDSSMIGLLVVSSRAHLERGGRLDLVIPEQSPLMRIVTIAGLPTILTIHATREAAFAHYELEE